MYRGRIKDCPCVLLLVVCFYICHVHQIAATPSVVWSGVQDIQMGLGNFEPEIDLDMNGINDFMFRHNFDDTEAFVLSAGNEFFCTINDEPAKYPPAARPEVAGGRADDSPDASHIWSGDNEGLGQIMMSFGSGYWAGADHAFMGVRFLADADLLYGWIEMSLDANAPYGMTIHSWAYETQPGVGITLGMVPEPSTWALFLVGGGCLLGVRLNRRASRRADIFCDISGNSGTPTQSLSH